MSAITFSLEAESSASLQLTGEVDEIEMQSIYLVAKNIVTPLWFLDHDDRVLRNNTWAVWIEVNEDTEEPRRPAVGTVKPGRKSSGPECTLRLEVSQRRFEMLLAAMQTGERKIDLFVTVLGTELAGDDVVWNLGTTRALSVESYSIDVALRTSRDIP